MAVPGLSAVVALACQQAGFQPRLRQEAVQAPVEQSFGQAEQSRTLQQQAAVQETSADPDAGGHAPADAVAPVRKEP